MSQIERSGPAQARPDNTSTTASINPPPGPNASPRPRSCCGFRGVRWPDGVQRCWHHTDEAGRALLIDLDKRAARIGVPLPPAGDRWYSIKLLDRLWPYGPNVNIDMRQRMVAWAERHGLTLAPRATRCLHWLRTGRCTEGGHPRQHWQDHVTAWKRHGQPAVLLAQPYGLAAEDIDHLVAIEADPLLHVDVDPDHGWYGFGTRPVAIWRRGPDTPRPPVTDPWCFHHGAPWLTAPGTCEECARLVRRAGRARRPWTGPTGHDGEDCLHCEVCDRCKGAGTVCRHCRRCTEHAEVTGAECELWAEWDRATQSARVYGFRHSFYDKATGRWNDPIDTEAAESLL